MATLDKENLPQIKREIKPLSKGAPGRIIRNTDLGRNGDQVNLLLGDQLNIEVQGQPELESILGDAGKRRSNRQNLESQASNDKEIEQQNTTRVGQICKNNQTINSPPDQTINSLPDQTINSSSDQVEPNDEKELVTQNEQSYQSFGCQKSAEQIIEQLKSRKKTKQVKEPRFAFLFIKGKTKQEFFSRLTKQINFQATFRNLKHQIRQKDKQSLSQGLEEQYEMKPEQLSLRVQQFDPFFKGKQVENASVFAGELYIAYSRVNRHWNEQITNKFNEEFLSHLWDTLCKPGSQWISLKTFTKELNACFGQESCLKPRDLFAIYSRIQPFTKEVFLQVLKCNRQVQIKTDQ